MDSLFKLLIKSDFVRARILAGLRHVLTAGATYLVVHGLANNEMAQDLIGLGIASASFYLSQADVFGVDKKIAAASASAEPVIIPVPLTSLPQTEHLGLVGTTK